MQKNILVSGSWFDNSSFAILTRFYAFGLLERLKNSDVNVKFFTQFMPLQTISIPIEDYNKIIENTHTLTTFVKHSIFFHIGTPKREKIITKYHVLLSMFESEILPDYFLEKYNNIDEIITPTEWGKNIFQKYNSANIITKIPLGVDQNIYNPKTVSNLNFHCINNFWQSTKNKYKPFPDYKFKFLSVFNWHMRKGPEVLLKSYIESAKKIKNKDHCLIVKTSYPTKINWPEFLMNFCIENKINYNALPPIYINYDNITNQEMAGLYNFCDCFISTSRGEGFCLPVIEASFCGLPVICPTHSAFQEYINDFVYPVYEDNYVYAKNIPGFSNDWSFGIFQDTLLPEFGQKVISQFSNHMIDIYENYETAKYKAFIFKNMNIKRYEKNVILNKVCERFLEIAKAIYNDKKLYIY